jgi:hypothetical protein
MTYGLYEWEFCATGILLLNELIVQGSLNAFQLGLKILPDLLEDTEPRIRQLCSRTIFALVNAETSGLASSILDNDAGTENASELSLQPINAAFAVYNSFGRQLLQRIHENFHRDVESRHTNLGSISSIPLDDTTGWKSLETSLVAYRELVRAYGSRLLQSQGLLVGDEVYDLLISQASGHMNRYIREFSHSFITVICDAVISHRSESAIHENAAIEANISSVSSVAIAADSGSVSAPEKADVPNTSSTSFFQVEIFNATLCLRIAKALREGLRDNWSQILHASLKATKSFLVALGTEETRANYWEYVIPGLSMCRYYVADGVNRPALDAWEAVLGGKGRETLASYLPAVVEHYIEMSKANNHMVSEAACHAMAELAARVDRTAVAPYVRPRLIDAVEACLTAESWPVRDAACLTSGVLVRWYPEETREKQALFFEYWEKNMKDAIWSVRENAAMAFGQVTVTNFERIYSPYIYITIVLLYSRTSDNFMQVFLFFHLLLYLF